MIAGTIFDFLIDFGVVTYSIGLYPLSFIGLILVMSVGMADEVVRAGIVQGELQENERRWRTLLDGIDQIVIGLDRAGRIDFVNPQFEKTTGYQAAEVVGKDWFQTLIPPSERPKIMHAFDEVLNNDFHRYYRNDILTRSGDKRTVAWSNVQLRDIEGTIQ